MVHSGYSTLDEKQYIIEQEQDGEQPAVSIMARRAAPHGIDEAQIEIDFAVDGEVEIGASLILSPEQALRLALAICPELMRLDNQK